MPPAWAGPRCSRPLSSVVKTFVKTLSIFSKRSHNSDFQIKQVAFTLPLLAVMNFLSGQGISLTWNMTAGALLGAVPGYYRGLKSEDDAIAMSDRSTAKEAQQQSAAALKKDD